MKRLTFLLLLLSCLSTARSQTGTLKFDHFTQKTGLPDQQIQFVQQDDQGYMWFGTLLGLVRYDGYNMKTYAFDDGAYQRKDIWTISSVTDADHNLWFSTLNLFGKATTGLVMYDRKADRLVSYHYPAKLKKMLIKELILQFADNRGNLWGVYATDALNTAWFAFRFDIHKKTYSYYGEQFSATHQNVAPTVPVRIFKSSGAVWLADSTGLNKFDYRDHTFHPFLSKKSGFNQVIRFAYEAPSEPGILWLNVADSASTHLQIARLDTRTKKLDYYDPSVTPGLLPANDSVNYAYEDSKRRLWFATQNGLLQFDRHAHAITGFVPGDTDSYAQKNQLTSIAEAKDGSLWLLNKRSLLRFDPQTHLFQRTGITTVDPDAVINDYFTGFMLDHSGILWVYEPSSGVHKLNTAESAFRFYPITVYDGSSDQVGFTNNIAIARDGFWWYTNLQGVFKWKPGDAEPTKIYKAPPHLTGGLDALYAGSDGKVYFANRRGFSILDPQKDTVEHHFFKKNDTTSVSATSINCIMQDHTGLVWIGTATGGVCTFDPVTKAIKRYPFDPTNHPDAGKGRLDSRITDWIYEDKQGTVWVGTDVGGLNRFDRATGRFRSYYVDGKLNVYTVTHIFEDNAGHFWVGTYSLGLFEFDRNTGHYIGHVNEDNGLLFNTVTGIEQDKKGYLWIGSVRGLTRIDPQNMEMKTFPLSTILPGRSLISDHNLVKTNDGKMIMVLTDGLAEFDPRDLERNAYGPDVHIEKIAYSNPSATSDSLTSKIAYGASQLTLLHNQNRITFTYIGLHFADAGQNKYAYRLEGFDQHWIQAGTQRSVTYTNLPPGTYTFFVKAANSDGVWNTKGDSFTIVIRPPWWTTWKAWVLYIVVFVIGLFWVITYRSRKLRRENRVLEQKVKVRTEEVLQQKEEIETQRDSLEHAYDELKATQAQLVQREKMASLGELTSGIAHEIQNPLNFVNNFSELNREMLEDLKAETCLPAGRAEKPKAERNEETVLQLINDLIENEEKINHHGKRADSIVKSMMEHSRPSAEQKELTDLNTLADEYLKLAYHGMRAKDKSLNAELITYFDEDLPKVNVAQQDIGRVMLNLFNNAFYAVNQKAKTAGEKYKPAVEIRTFTPTSGGWGATILDNGIGIPAAIKDKIMQPFFTTKPTGEGTGLGLSLSYDIVVKGHGGTIDVASKAGEGSVFTITLPLN